MFGSIGIPELLVILVVALIVIGPKRMPDMAKSLGRALRDFKRATSDFQENLNLDLDDSTPDYTDSISEAAGEEKTPQPPGSAENTIAPPEDQTESGEAGPSGSTESSAGPDDPSQDDPNPDGPNEAPPTKRAETP